MARLDIVEGGIEFTLKDNDQVMVRTNAKGVVASDVEELKSPQLVQIFNMTSGKPVTKFRDHKTAVKRTQAALNEYLEEQATTPEPVDGKRGRAPRHTDDMRVKILAEENPKRKGSKSYDRFELYRQGMTVAQAVEAGLRREDLRWDSDHGFIEVS